MVNRIATVQEAIKRLSQSPNAEGTVTLSRQEVADLKALLRSARYAEQNAATWQRRAQEAGPRMPWRTDEE